MKKIILSLLAILIFGISNAQLREKGTIELAPQIGSSSAKYYNNNNYNNNSYLSGVAFGVGADYFFNNRWSLRSGLISQTMGSQYYGGEDKLNYLTIPVNANWHFGSTRKWNLNFGPSMSFLMSAKVNGNDIKELVAATQIGLSVGIGYKIEVSKKFSILFDYQGVSGLTDASKNGNGIRNSFGSFDVGGVFKL